MNKPYLKSMDIHGFRSFPNQTHIDFSPKINAILGAHETGKTNILDAIKSEAMQQNMYMIMSKQMTVAKDEPCTD